jgi:hypothetical protein
MSVRVDIEELQATKTEKFLAGVLAVFCLIGAVWTYQKIDDWVGDRIELEAPVSAADEAAIGRAEAARERSFRAAQTVGEVRRQLVFRREEYRTALDAGRTAPRLEARYRASQRALTRAERDARAAEGELRRAAPAAQAAEKRRQEAFQERQDRRERNTALLRLALAAILLTAGFWLLWALHRRRSRYLPLALGFIAAAAILAFVLAGDYLTDYVDPLDLGVLALSLFGIAVTLLVFYLLQRYIVQRLPSRRVKRHQCPFCGYPAGDNEFCERCGRAVVGACAKCNQPRRVGTVHCGACGAS